MNHVSVSVSVNFKLQTPVAVLTPVLMLVSTLVLVSRSAI